MTHVQVQGEIGASADAVWAVVGDFGGLVRALGGPVELEGEGIGQLRTITFGSHAVVERLEELDQDAKRITYVILQPGPLPVRDYRATMQLEPSGDGSCTLTWFSDFEPQGASEEDAVKAVRGVYDGGIAGLQRHFAS
jgi:Polyketide cyclase / dehydrase and lipid transport